MILQSTVHKYPAARVALLLVAGIVIGRLCVVSVQLLVGVCVALMTTSFLLFSLSHRARRCAGSLHFSVALLCVTIGIGKIAVDTSATSLEESIPSHAELVLRGTVIEILGSTENRLQCVVAGEALFTDSCRYPVTSNVRVTLRRRRSDPEMIRLRYGMTIECRGLLSLFPEQRNPGEFNMRAYCEALGISKQMLVRGLDNVSILDSSAGIWYMRAVVDPVRTYILDHISSTIKGQEGEFLKGILIGERGGISTSNRVAFANAGVAHVLAVSGSNVAVVAAAVFVVLGFLRLSKVTRIALMSVGLVLFMFIAGNQAPVVRATIMALVFFFGPLVQVKPNPYNSIALAALIILMADARQLFDVGFQLSFVAALAIVHLYPILNRLIGGLPAATLMQRGIAWVLRVCAVSAAAMLGTLPITALYFGRVSIIGLLANTVVVPLVGVSVIVGLVSIGGGILSTSLEEIFAAINIIMLRGTLFFTDFAAGLPLATFDAYRIQPVDALPYYSGLILLFHLNRAVIAKRLLIVFLIALDLATFVSVSESTNPTAGRVRMNFIDVGQGDAVLIEFPGGRNILIDAGPKSADFDAGERIVVPFLKRKGISVIDLLVVSHPDADHLGGVPGVLRNFKVRAVLDNGLIAPSDLYAEYNREVKRVGTKLLRGRAGTSLEVDAGARMYILSPSPLFIRSDISSAELSMNNASVVLKLQHGNVSFLLVGDAAMEAEEEMLKTYGDFLKSTVLKIGHHGSRTSSSEVFLDAVRPEYAVLSVGKYNRFNHPSPDVIRRLNDSRVDIVRTDEEGAIVFESNGSSLWHVDWR